MLPVRPLAVVVAFSGYTNDVNGERVASLQSVTTVVCPFRRWDRYEIEISGQARPGPTIIVADAGNATWTA